MTATYILFSLSAWNIEPKSLLVKFDDKDNAIKFLKEYGSIINEWVWDLADKIICISSPEWTQRKNVDETFLWDLIDNKEILAKKIINFFI